MARAVQMDQYHLTAYAPPDLAAVEYAAIRRTLDDRGFHAALRRAVRRVVRDFPSLGKVRFTLSR